MRLLDGRGRGGVQCVDPSLLSHGAVRSTPELSLFIFLWITRSDEIEPRAAVGCCVNRARFVSTYLTTGGNSGAKVVGPTACLAASSRGLHHPRRLDQRRRTSASSKFGARSVRRSE